MCVWFVLLPPRPQHAAVRATTGHWRLLSLVGQVCCVPAAISQSAARPVLLRLLQLLLLLLLLLVLVVANQQLSIVVLEIVVEVFIRISVVRSRILILSLSLVLRLG